MKLRGSWKVSEGLDGTFGPRWSLRVWKVSEGFGGSERVLKFFEVLEGCGAVEKGPGE